jgi:hypothetical protein
MGTTATTIAITSAANAQAATANAAAQEAARKACMAQVRGYEHDRATVAEMRAYAGCIGRLHPQELSADAMTGLKVVVAVLLAGAVIGVVREWRDPFRGGLIKTVMVGSIMGLCVSGGGLLLAAGAWYGVKLLLA